MDGKVMRNVVNIHRCFRSIIFSYEASSKASILYITGNTRWFMFHWTRK